MNHVFRSVRIPSTEPSDSTAEHHTCHLPRPKAHAETKEEKQSGGSAQTSLVSGLLWFWVKTLKKHPETTMMGLVPDIFMDI